MGAPAANAAAKRRGARNSGPPGGGNLRAALTTTRWVGANRGCQTPYTNRRRRRAGRAARHAPRGADHPAARNCALVARPTDHRDRQAARIVARQAAGAVAPGPMEGGPVTARRSCAACGAPLRARRSTKRFCSERCKKRAQRAALRACPAKDARQHPVSGTPRPGPRPQAARPEPWTLPGRCDWCGMPLDPRRDPYSFGAPVGDLHPECASYLAQQDARRAATRPGVHHLD